MAFVLTSQQWLPNLIWNSYPFNAILLCWFHVDTEKSQHEIWDRLFNKISTTQHYILIVVKYVLILDGTVGKLMTFYLAPPWGCHFSEWIGIGCGTVIYAPLRINWNDLKVLGSLMLCRRVLLVFCSDFITHCRAFPFWLVWSILLFLAQNVNV